MKKPSRTDWARVDAMTDDQVDTSEAPPLDEKFFAEAELRMPVNKETVTIRLDPDVLTWLKSQGRGYQTRINAILRRYMEAQQRS